MKGNEGRSKGGYEGRVRRSGEIGGDHLAEEGPGQRDTRGGVEVRVARPRHLAIDDLELLVDRKRAQFIIEAEEGGGEADCCEK